MIDVILFNDQGKVARQMCPTPESAVGVGKKLYDEHRDKGMTKLAVGFYVSGKLIRLVNSRAELARWAP